MQEIIINELNEGQRLNKFLGKYFDDAPQSFIYKMLRKKNIKWNNKKASGNEMIQAGENWDTYFERYPNADKNEYLYTFLTGLYIDKVNGKKLMSIEVEDMLNNIDIIDYRALKDVVGNLTNLYGYVETIVGKCPSCTKDVKHGLPITSELFTPSK